VFADITKEGDLTNVSYLDRGIGGPIADYQIMSNGMLVILTVDGHINL
jgi:hypothetical protein